MLLIRQLPINHSYTSTTTYDVSSEIFLNPLIGPWINGSFSSPTNLLRIDGLLVDGRKTDDFGDRDCHHQQISGQALVYPFVWTKTGVSHFLNEVIRIQTSPTTYVNASAILSPGTRLVNRYVTPSRSYLVIQEVDASGLNVHALVMYRKLPAIRYVGFEFQVQLRSDLAYRRMVSKTYTDATSLTEQGVLNLPIVPLTTGTYKSMIVKPVFAPIDPDVLRLSIMSYVPRREMSDHFLPSCISEDPDAFGDLAQSCAERLKYLDINSIAYAKDWLDFFKSLRVKRILSFKSPKTWASAFLTFVYGMKLTIADTEEIRTGIQRLSKDAKAFKEYQQVFASKTLQHEYRGYIFEEEYHYKITCSPYPDSLRSMIRKMKEWDIDPSLGNLWDLVPYSFVVDWFADVSSLLERIETQSFLETYQVFGICRSRKVSVTLPINDLMPLFPGSGDVSLIEYKRQVRPHLDLPRWRIDRPESFNNVVELLAILVQKLT